jgi:hypothetical protein
MNKTFQGPGRSGETPSVMERRWQAAWGQELARLTTPGPLLC